MSSNATLDRFWAEFARIEPTAELGGIDANKPGYHERRIDLPDDDYSVSQVAADRRGRSTVAAGIDLTMWPAGGPAMRKYTGRLQAAALSHDQRLYLRGGPTLREYIGTTNGTTVECYVFTGGKPLGVKRDDEPADSGFDFGRDPSHLWHIHLSVIRQYAEDWEALDAVLSVLRGESLAAWRARIEDDMTPEQLKLLNDMAWQVRNVPSIAGGREVLTGAAGKLVERMLDTEERVLVAEKKLAELAPASGLTPEQWAGVVARAEAEAREEVAQLRADLAALGADDEPQA